MGHLAKALRTNRLLWGLVLAPVPLLAERMAPDAHTLVFLVSAIAIIPLAALLSLATEQVAERTGDAIGGLLNATLGNLTEMIIMIAALMAGDFVLIKSAIAGAIIANVLFMMGVSFLIGGLSHKVQTFTVAGARIQVAELFLASFALMVPSALASADSVAMPTGLSFLLAFVLIGTYMLGLLFALGTHRTLLEKAAEAADAAGGGRHDDGHDPWPVGLAVGVLVVATVIIAMVSEVFVGSLEGAAHELGMTEAFVGFVIVAIIGASAEMVTAFAAASRNRLDLSIGIAFGSASQIALFVAPVLVILSHFIGPAPMGLDFKPAAILMMFVAVFTAALVTAGGRSAWFTGAMMLVVYLIFALTLYTLPPVGA